MTEHRDVVGLLCNLCTSFFNSTINILILGVPTLKLRIVIIILPTDRPDAILLPIKQKIKFA